MIFFGIIISNVYKKHDTFENFWRSFHEQPSRGIQGEHICIHGESDPQVIKFNVVFKVKTIICSSTLNFKLSQSTSLQCPMRRKVVKESENKVLDLHLNWVRCLEISCQCIAKSDGTAI